MLANLRNILAIELLAACQGIDLLAPLRPGPETRKAYDIVRVALEAVDADRSLAPDIEAVSRASRARAAVQRSIASCSPTQLLPSASVEEMCRSGSRRCS